MGKNWPCKFLKKFNLNLKEETLSLDLKGLEDFCRKISLNINVGSVICLFGDLGSGKTTFARYLIKSLYKKYKKKSPISIKSPTFPILLTYEINNFEIYHYDLYRISKSIELIELNIFEELANSITLIEWPEIFLNSINTIKYSSINFKIIDENERIVKHNLLL